MPHTTTSSEAEPHTTNSEAEPHIYTEAVPHNYQQSGSALPAPIVWQRPQNNIYHIIMESAMRGAPV